MSGTATRRDPGQDPGFDDRALSGRAAQAEEGRSANPGLNDSAAGPAVDGGAS